MAGDPKRPASTTTREAGQLAWVMPIAFAFGGVVLIALHIGRYPVPDLEADGLGLPTLDRVAFAAGTLGWLALLNASAWSAGRCLGLWLPLPGALADLRFAYRTALGFGALGIATLGAAALGALHALGFAVILGLPIATLLGLGALRDPSVLPRLRVPHPETLLYTALVMLLLTGAVVKAFGSDPGWDALTYHLSFPARYIDENAIVMTPFSHLSGYIATGEMLYLLALGLSGNALAVLVHLEFGVLILVTVALFCRRYSTTAGWLAPLLLLADPLFQSELSWAYTDLTLGLYVTLASIALLSAIDDDRDVRALVYAGLCCGLACATRYLGVTFAGALVVLAWLPPRHRRVGANVRIALWLGVISLAVVAPFLIRNAVFTGNPVTPLVQALFHAAGDAYIPEIVMDQSAGFLRFVGMGRGPLDLVALPWNLVMRSQPGTYEASFGFQIGPLIPFGIVMGLCLGAIRRDRHLRSLLVLVLIYTLIWFYSFQEARFLLPIFPIGAIIGAVALGRVAEASPLGRVVLVLPVVGVVYTQLLLLPGALAQYPAAFAEGASAPERGSVAAARMLGDEMTEGDRLFLWLEERALLFRGLDYVPFHIGSGSPSLALVHEQPHGAALHCTLTELGVTHVLVNENFRRAAPGLYQPGYREADYRRDLDRMATLLRNEGDRLFERDRVSVYRLAPSDCR